MFIEIHKRPARSCVLCCVSVFCVCSFVGFSPEIRGVDTKPRDSSQSLVDTYVCPSSFSSCRPRTRINFTLSLWNETRPGRVG